MLKFLSMENAMQACPHKGLVNSCCLSYSCKCAACNGVCRKSPGHWGQSDDRKMSNVKMLPEWKVTENENKVQHNLLTELPK